MTTRKQTAKSTPDPTAQAEPSSPPPVLSEWDNEAEDLLAGIDAGNTYSYVAIVTGTVYAGNDQDALTYSTGRARLQLTHEIVFAEGKIALPEAPLIEIYRFLSRNGFRAMTPTSARWDERLT
jgi:hypothetical protein